jgi:hypothetical protein
VPSTTVFHDVTVVNQGTVTIYVGSGSIASSTPTLGLAVPAGGQLTIQGYSGTVGTAGTIWAQAGAASQTGQTAAGMPSVASVV